MADNFWPADYWPDNYWPAGFWPALPEYLNRTEKVTILPNSFYPVGYWVNNYWPLAYGRIAFGRMCMAVNITVPGVEMSLTAPTIDIEIEANCNEL